MNSIQRAVVIAAQTGVPVLIEGGPGCGKTSWVEAAFKGMGCEVETVIASIRMPEDFGGMPVTDLANPDGPAVIRIAERWAKALCKAAKNGKRPLLFLDEIKACPSAVQKALLRVTFGGYVGDTKLPADLMIVAACNPASMNGYELDAPLANRFLHLAWELTTEDWIEGMVSGFPTPVVERVPEEWAKNLPEFRAIIASFVRAQPGMVGEAAIPKDEAEQGKAFPTFRTWDMAAKVLAAAKSVGVGMKKADKSVDSEGVPIVAALVAGCVGEAAQIAFSSYLRELDLPDPAEVLKNPDAYVLPARGDRAYAVLSSIVSYSLQHPTKENWKGCWAVMAKAHDADHPDIAAQAARMLCRAMGKGLPFFGNTPTLDAVKFAPLLKAAGFLGDNSKGGK